ncbi:MAG: winged helix-turn-helix transcriptional regulator, partial [Thermomicrobiaceae bacterium]|nr:winged helix-turn-helix transcriptional regulator [Thermomicrobiaceae bacterium]
MSLYDPARRAESRAARVGMALLRLSQAVKKLSLAEAQGEGLTPVQAQTLLFLRHTKPFLCTVGRLAAELGATHATAVGVVDALERRGRGAWALDAGDGRVSLLRLTPLGEARCRGLERYGQALEEALGALSDQALADLERGLGTLVWALREAGALQVGEPCRGCLHFREAAAPGHREPHYCDLI